MYISDYMRGVLFGDGKLLPNHSRYLFSTTRVDLKNTVESFLQENDVSYYTKTFTFHGEKENYEDIHKVFIVKEFYHECLKAYEESLPLNMNAAFLLGYVETKGSFFEYTEKKPEGDVKRWRLSLSGDQETLQFIKAHFERKAIHFTNLVHRRERANQGIVSKSYRMYLNRRKDLRTLIDQFMHYDCTPHLKNAFERFIAYDEGTPQIKAKVSYKNHRLACMYLMKELGVEYRGNKTDNVDGTSIKKIYRIEQGERKEYERGWEGVYRKLVADYEARFHQPGPKVQINEPIT